MACVPARAGVTQTDTLSCIHGPVAGASCCFERGRLAKRMFSSENNSATFGERPQDVTEDAEAIDKVKG